MPTLTAKQAEQRIADLEREVRDLKRKIQGAYPEPDHRDSQGGKPSWETDIFGRTVGTQKRGGQTQADKMRDLASIGNHQLGSRYP